MLQNGSKFNDVRQVIADNNVTDYAELYKLLYDEVDLYAKDDAPSVILEIAESQYRDAYVVDKEINFMALIVNILKILRSENEL